MAVIKVLIVEDSNLVAEILTEALESDKRVRVVGVAANGLEAIKLMPKLMPDLVTMDVWMPVMDGFTTVEWIMANQPTPILVITSSRLKEDVEVSLRMLAAGALDVIEKPSLNNDQEWKQRQGELVAKIKMLAGVRVITHVRGKENPELKRLTESSQAPTQTRPESSPKPPVSSSHPPVRETGPAYTPATPGRYVFPANPHYQLIAFVSSTGGPTALLRILQKLPPELPCGILIVQHISDGFTQGLVDWLQRDTPLKLRIAHDGDTPEPGLVLLAPDRRDMWLRPDCKIATGGEETNILRPNGDILLKSVAEVYGRRAIGLVLTGMGQDGAKGLKLMYNAGAYTIGQDEASSLIYGMPRAAAEMGAVRLVLPLEKIAPRLVELMQLPLQSENLPKPSLPDKRDWGD
jgi:two-component system chemotaxis response regulator CheB